MAKDIEEFLKMAAQRRQQQKQNAGGQQAVPPQQPKPVQQPPAQKPPVQRPTAQRRPPALQQPAAQRQRPQPAQPVRQLSQQSVSDHVRQHIDTSDVVARAELLGEEVGLADEKLDERLHDVFDHSVSRMENQKQSSGETVASSNRNTSRVAAQLHAMLRSPASVRHAIVLAEILKRPDFD